MKLLVVSSVAAVAIAGVVLSATDTSYPLATVDGVAITSEDYSEYARVFTAPDGTLRVPEQEVLLSLVNQILVEREAIRRDIRVSDAFISEALANMDAAQHGGIVTLPNVVDDAAFQKRLRLFLLFKLIKADVVDPVHISADQIRAEYDADPVFRILDYEDVAPELKERLAKAEADRRWIEWLHTQRTCADIHVFEATFEVPSSTPAPGCANGTAR